MDKIMEFLGFGFIVAFFVTFLGFVFLEKKGFHPVFREIGAFSKLKQALNLAVEGGRRIHITMGRGGIFDIRAGSGFVGLALLKHISRTGSISDRAPVSSSGDAVISMLAQDIQTGFYRTMGDTKLKLYEPTQNQLSGLTPWSYAAGVVPILHDEFVAVNVVAGNLSSEVGLLTGAAQQEQSLAVGCSDNLVAQAILVASLPEPLIGEELYASGAYIQGGIFNRASISAQDFMRWVVIGVILVGIAVKIFGLE